MKNHTFIQGVQKRILDLPEGAVEAFKSIRPVINNDTILKSYSIKSVTQKPDEEAEFLKNFNEQRKRRESSAQYVFNQISEMGSTQNIDL